MITAARRKSLSLAGLMFVKVNALLVVRHRGNLSKPVILWATDSGSVEVYFETSKRAGKRSETDCREDSVSGAGGGCGAHHTASYKLPHRDKKGLRSEGIPVYGYSAPAKSGAGISLPDMIEATHDAPSVFFCVVNSVHPFFSDAVIIRAAIKIMVGCVGASSEAPGSLITGKANLAQFTTRQISLCGGGYIPLIKEAAKWLLPLPKFRNLSGLSPHLLSVKPAVLWFGITSAFSLVASVWRWLMRNYFRITGYAVNKRGLTVGIGYQLTSSDTKTATAHAVLQAQREGLSHVRITRVREVAA